MSRRGLLALVLSVLIAATVALTVAITSNDSEPEAHDRPCPGGALACPELAEKVPAE